MLEDDPADTAQRLPARLGAVLFLVRVAWADHGAGSSPVSGSAHPWLIAVGVVALLAAVAWALFGPGAREPEDGTRDARGPDSDR